MKTLIFLSAFVLVLSSCTKEVPVPDGSADPDQVYYQDPYDDPNDPGYTDPSDPGYSDPSDPGNSDPSDPGYDDPSDPGDGDPSSSSHTHHQGSATMHTAPKSLK